MGGRRGGGRGSTKARKGVEGRKQICVPGFRMISLVQEEGRDYSSVTDYLDHRLLYL